MKKLKTFLAFILSIICICLLIGFTACYTISHYVSGETIKKMITDNDFSTVLNDLYQENEEILEGTKQVFEALNIPSDAIEQVINSDATKNFIGIYASNTVDALFGNEEEKVLTKEDLKSLIKDNLDIIQQQMPSEEKEFLENYENIAYDYIDEHGDEIISYFPTPKEIFGEVDQSKIKVYNDISLKQVIDFINLITSLKFLIIYSLIILFVLLLIYLLKRKVRWARYYTGVFTTYSFIMIFVEVILLTVMKSTIMNELESFSTIVNYLINGLSKTIWMFIIPSLIIAIICYCFYRKKKGLIKDESVSSKLSE